MPRTRRPGPMKGLQLIAKGRRRVQIIKDIDRAKLGTPKDRATLKKFFAERAATDFTRGYRLLGK